VERKIWRLKKVNITIKRLTKVLSQNLEEALVNSIHKKSSANLTQRLKKETLIIQISKQTEV
jgi:hypothetical protein